MHSVRLPFEISHHKQKLKMTEEGVTTKSKATIISKTYLVRLKIKKLQTHPNIFCESVGKGDLFTGRNTSNPTTEALEIKTFLAS